MNETQGGSSMQVLSVEADGTYRADEAALRRVAAHEAARALPAVVVSVAGATRGGKSFLLDFFLRYLRASEAARRDGSWLGADTEPLTGFSWRGGCERDTKGILIWSEPIVVTLGPEENSEKVAVVLMDTQGTFDSSSTVRDSSTIFAMSTLLSSVQIYNLSQNIKEDDLQYLQLFTEYGKLAQESGKQFQELRFLVRDWSYAYEHPQGAEGGQQLLDKRLEIREEQAEELREIRTHVRSAFERVACFLLPHPGLVVATSPDFKGCPADIAPEFKKCLLELVSSLLAPENLVIKEINGRQVTLQEFADYFRTYTEIFNSDTIPTPMTIMQATSMASLEISLRAAREAYRASMETPEGAYVARASLARVHGAALEHARAAHGARRTLAPQQHAAARLEALIQELDTMLPSYVSINEGRILAAIAACKASYEEAVHCDSCLTAAELADRHAVAAATAREALEAARVATSDDIDDDDDKIWTALEKELNDLVPVYRERNEETISAAISAACELYSERMRGGMGAAACLNPKTLVTLHSTNKSNAYDTLREAWQGGEVPDLHMETLQARIEELHNEFLCENIVNNQREVKAAAEIYKNRMSEICITGDGSCLHPRDVILEHQQAETTAFEYFVEHRDIAERSPREDDSFTILLSSAIQKHYCEFRTYNLKSNANAVKIAHDHYLARIAPARHGAEGLLEVFGPLDFGIFTRHEPIKNDAIELFKQKRRPGRLYGDDIYLDDLQKKINASFTWLITKLFTSLGFAGINIAMMTGLFFFKR